MPTRMRGSSSAGPRPSLLGIDPKVENDDLSNEGMEGFLSELTNAILGVDEAMSFAEMLKNFHAGVYMLAWSRKKEGIVGLKAPQKEKRVKRENRTQPNVEAPYVSPKPKTATKSPNKTVDIFVGMTLLDLSKRIGAYISTVTRDTCGFW